MTSSATTSGQSARATVVTLQDVQAPVRSSLDRVGDELARILAGDGMVASDVTVHLAAMRGKLFRPTLLLLASRVAGRAEPRAVSVAAALEVLHLASLVHDDAVDHSVMRRGMPTINALFSHQTAVLLGDLLYARALTELVRLGDWDVAQVFAEASTRMTVGELRQLGTADALAFTELDYDQLIRAKTASLFRAACDLGALCGAHAYRASLARYGERLGMLFQVIDDLLDYTEVQEVTGKPSGLDLREHKVTLPLIAVLPGLSRAERRRVDELFASTDPDDQLVAEVVALVAAHGGLEYARARVDRLASDAEDAVSELPESPARSALADAIAYAQDRRS
ncbi:MAG: polyprenyl synthetase family protein [Candidatus Eremiobacteraeota bacterium]|nr:polyprenyl synthetase family protein [Candidatus Eremiobacteraeota bacterium]